MSFVFPRSRLTVTNSKGEIVLRMGLAREEFPNAWQLGGYRSRLWEDCRARWPDFLVEIEEEK